MINPKQLWKNIIYCILFNIFSYYMLPFILIRHNSRNEKQMEGTIKKNGINIKMGKKDLWDDTHS